MKKKETLIGVVELFFFFPKSDEIWRVQSGMAIEGVVKLKAMVSYKAEEYTAKELPIIGETQG